MDFEELIRKRSSTRKFQDKKLEKDKLDKILEAGRLAPTAKNIQPQVIYIIDSEDGIKKINEASPCIYGAKTVLLVCGNIDIAFTKEDHTTLEVDTSIVTTHMMLEATNIGVDNIWIDLFDRKKVIELFNLPDNLKPVALLPLGYRTDDCPESHGHNTRKSIEELVKYV